MKRVLYLAAAFIPGLLLVAYLYNTQPHSDSIAPVPLDQLGLHPQHEEYALKIAARYKPFAIFGAPQDNARRNVRLWDAVIQVRGAHLPNVPQQIGDCVSHGSANAKNFLQCQQIAAGESSEFHPAFPPFEYGASRITIGLNKHGARFGNSDGSVGAYVAESSQQCGTLPADHAQCPPYDGSVAKQWGKNGPPKWAIEAAKEFRVETIAQMKTADDVRDAICNLYPVIICSQFGTNTIRPRDGRQVAKHDASWAHCMCVCAYDGSASEPYFYVLNSWGPNAHPAPLQGEPPGGFWIDRPTMTYIVKSGDCWAYSQLKGFPAQELDLSPLRPRHASRDAAPATRSFGGSKS